MRLRTFFQQQLKALDALGDVKSPRFPEPGRSPARPRPDTRMEPSDGGVPERPFYRGG